MFKNEEQIRGGGGGVNMVGFYNNFSALNF